MASLRKVLKKADPSRLLKGKIPGVQDTGPLQDILNRSGEEQRGLIEQRRGQLASLADILAQSQRGLLETGGQEQRGLINALRPQLTPLSQEFRTNALAAGRGAQSEAEARNAQFLRDVMSSRDELAKLQSGDLRQRTLAAQPELQQQLRESLAGTVGLRGGAATRGAQNIARQAARDIAQGETDIQGQTLQARLGALEGNRNVSEQLAREVLGIDKSTLDAIYSSGRQDLINETNALLQEAQQRQGGLLDVEGQRGERQFGVLDQAQTGLLGEAQARGQGQLELEQLRREQQQARDIARANQRNRITNMLLTGAGTAAGAAIGGPIGAQVGGQLGGSLGPGTGQEESGGFAPAFGQLMGATGSKLGQAFRRRRQPTTPSISSNLNLPGYTPGRGYY